MLRSRRARLIASAVYFLPSAQSVPTVRSRLPRALQPRADRNVARRLPNIDQPLSRPIGRIAQRRECRLSCACMPLMMCRPALSASMSAGIQVSAMNPPELATPMTSDWAPRDRASAGDELRQASRHRRPGERKLADATACRPVAKTESGLRVARLRRVPQKQEVGRRKIEHSGAHGQGRVHGDYAQPQKATSTARPRVRGCTGTVPMKPGLGVDMLLVIRPSESVRLRA